MMKLRRSHLKYLLLLLPVTYFLKENHVPAPFNIITFIEDHPGAGDRYTTFTPVLKADNSKVIGETVGADYGALHYRDCDGDGVPEAVVETDKSSATGEYMASSRTVYKYLKGEDGQPHLKTISSEELPEEDPEWVRGPFVGKPPKRYCSP
jgi:hypothetical protein